MARSTLATHISRVEDLVRTRDLDEDIIPYLLSVSLSDMAANLDDLPIFHSVLLSGAVAGTSSVVIDFSSSYNIAANVRSAQFVSTSPGGLAYMPEYCPWDQFREEIDYRIDTMPHQAHPQIWSQEIYDPEGKVRIHYYPLADVNYLLYLHVSFVPHLVETTSQYLMLNDATEFAVALGAAYMASRGEMEEIAALYHREFELAKIDLRMGFGSSLGLNSTLGGGSISVDKSRRPRQPYIKETGSAPVIAWDSNPAIPYDPANPDQGYPV